MLEDVIRKFTDLKHPKLSRLLCLGVCVCVFYSQYQIWSQVSCPHHPIEIADFVISFFKKHNLFYNAPKNCSYQEFLINETIYQLVSLSKVHALPSYLCIIISISTRIYRFISCILKHHILARVIEFSLYGADTGYKSRVVLFFSNSCA